MYLFPILAVQHSCYSVRRQHSPLLRHAGPASRDGAGRHWTTGLRDESQVSMRHLPVVSDGSNFSRTHDSTVHINLLISCNFILALSFTTGRSSLIFSSCYKQAILERMHITPSGIEDFASSRRHIDNLSVWTIFQLFHSTLLESDRAAVSFVVWKNKKRKHR